MAVRFMYLAGYTINPVTATIAAISVGVGIDFAVLGMAPMPIFASYGVLTAVMIALAVAVTLLVLPSWLLFVTPSLKGEEREELEWGYLPHKRETAIEVPSGPVAI